MRSVCASAGVRARSKQAGLGRGVHGVTRAYDVMLTNEVTIAAVADKIKKPNVEEATV